MSSYSDAAQASFNRAQEAYDRQLPPEYEEEMSIDELRDEARYLIGRNGSGELTDTVTALLDALDEQDRHKGGV